MSEEKFIELVFLFVLIELILFLIYQFTRKIKILHRILSIVNTVALCLLLGYGFYRIQPLFVIFVPFVFLVELPISWGLNKELSDKDAASVVVLKVPFPLREKNRVRLKIGFLHFATFPFFYLLDSWSKT